MPSIPGYCARCDFVFDGTGGIHIENSVNVTLRAGKMTCPRCGRLANLASGTFNATSDTLELVAGPPLTAEILSRLRDIAERAKVGEITSRQAVMEASEIDPVAGRLFSEYLALGSQALFALLTLITLYLTHLSLEASLEATEVSKQSLELQRSDSRISGDFYRDALNELRKQTAILEDLKLQGGIVPHQSENVQLEGDHGDAERTIPRRETKEKRPPAVKKSDRRAKVNAERRRALKERRRMFPRRKQRL